MRKVKKSTIPDVSEFTDEDGKRWVQTSTEDLFSIKELNEILESVEKDREEGEIVLARIDFQRVNKEYYATVKELQSKLKKRNDILKKLIIESTTTIDRKNKKLKELIEYIRKLHLLLAYYKLKPENIDKIDFSPQALVATKKVVVEEVREEQPEVPAIPYSGVEEIMLDDEGNEGTTVPS